MGKQTALARRSTSPQARGASPRSLAHILVPFAAASIITLPRCRAQGRRLHLRPLSRAVPGSSHAPPRKADLLGISGDDLKSHFLPPPPPFHPKFWRPRPSPATNPHCVAHTSHPRPPPKDSLDIVSYILLIQPRPSRQQHALPTTASHARDLDLFTLSKPQCRSGRRSSLSSIEKHILDGKHSLSPWDQSTSLAPQREAVRILHRILSSSCSSTLGTPTPGHSPCPSHTPAGLQRPPRLL